MLAPHNYSLRCPTLTREGIPVGYKCHIGHVHDLGLQGGAWFARSGDWEQQPAPEQPVAEMSRSFYLNTTNVVSWRK